MKRALVQKTFTQAHLKIKRANRHIHEAQSIFDAYVKSDFYKLIEHLDTKTNERVISLRTDPMPIGIALAVGDAFHCLNTALDYVASGLMQAKTGNSTRVTFPSDETRKGLRKSFMPPRQGKTAPTNRRIVMALPWLVFDLLTVIQPYRGGNYGLWEVRKADNIDKHNMIVPNIHFSGVDGVSWFNYDKNSFGAANAFTAKPGAFREILRLPAGDNVEFHHDGGVTAGIKFPKTLEVFAGQPLFPTLTQCAQFVHGAVSIIELAALKRI